MRRAIFGVVAALLLSTSIVTPAFGNGIERGNSITVAIKDLPDICPAGMVMHGWAVIEVLPDASRVKQTVTLEVTVDTPFGDATVMTESFKMLPGTSRSVRLNIPVAENVPMGDYHFDFTVSTKSETVTVGHDVRVVPQM
jgi:hypothetical protein